MLHILGQAILGFCVGIIAKLLVPGRDPGGILVTAGIGVAGALLGTLAGRAWKRENYQAGWVMSIVGAIVLLVLYRWYAGGLG